MKDIPIPSSEEDKLRSLVAIFHCAYFPIVSQREDVKKARFPTSQSLHCRGRIMNAQVYEVGMQTRPVAVARKRNESPFYSVDKIDTTRRGPPVCRREKGRHGPLGWIAETTDGRMHSKHRTMGFSRIPSFPPSKYGRQPMLNLILIRVTRLQ